jgi:hypothetical protein
MFRNFINFLFLLLKNIKILDWFNLINQKTKKIKNQAVCSGILSVYPNCGFTFLMGNHNLLPFFKISEVSEPIETCVHFCKLLFSLDQISKFDWYELIIQKQGWERIRENQAMYTGLLSVCANCGYAFQMSNLDLLPGLWNL